MRTKEMLIHFLPLSLSELESYTLDTTAHCQKLCKITCSKSSLWHAVFFYSSLNLFPWCVAIFSAGPGCALWQSLGAVCVYCGAAPASSQWSPAALRAASIFLLTPSADHLDSSCDLLFFFLEVTSPSVADVDLSGKQELQIQLRTLVLMGCFSCVSV